MVATGNPPLPQFKSPSARSLPGPEGFVDHLLDEAGLQLREVVDVLAGVLAVRDAESEVEVERFQMAIPLGATEKSV